MVLDTFMLSQIRHGTGTVKSGVQLIYFRDSEPTKRPALSEIITYITIGGLMTFVLQNEHLLKNFQGCEQRENGISATPKTQPISLTLSPTDYEAQEVLLKKKYGIPKLMDDANE